MTVFLTTVIYNAYIETSALVQACYTVDNGEAFDRIILCSVIFMHETYIEQYMQRASSFVTSNFGPTSSTTIAWSDFFWNNS